MPEGLTGKAPAIVMFHGGKGALGHTAGKFWTDYRDEGVILIFPNGQTDRPDLAAWTPTNGDVGQHVDFTVKLLDALTEAYPIDRDHVYASGFSIGAQHTFRVACLAPERFAGFAAVAQTMQEDTLEACKPDVVRPMLWITGTADPKNPENGRDARNDDNAAHIGIDELLLIEGGGHHWPTKGSTGEPSQCSDIDGADEAVAFWKANAGLVAR